MNQTLRRLHAPFATPQRALFALVTRVTGRTPVRSEQVIRGYENEVHYVATGTAGYFVRIRRHGEVPLAREAWALAQAKAAGVPVPEVIAVDDIEVAGEALEAMVQAPAAGRPLSDLLPGPPPRALAQIGDLLARLHSIPAAGCGRQISDDTWEYPDWRAWIEREAQRRRAAEPYLRQAGFSAADTAFMLDQLRAYPDRFPCAKPAFCHGDIEPDHLFFDDDLKLSAVIDFGQIQGNSPLQDFIYLSFYLSGQQMESIKSAYPASADFDRRLHLQRLVFLMGCVAHVVMEGDEHVDKTPDALGQLRTTLAALRGYAG